MSTDPFGHIRPLSVEIGQSTYFELISVSRREEVAIRNNGRTVEDVYAELAFKKRKNRYIPINTSLTDYDLAVSKNQYNICCNEISNPITNKFRSLISNDPESVIDLIKGECNIGCERVWIYGGYNTILNSTFDANIAGWEITNGNVVWDSANKRMVIDGGSVEQKVDNLSVGAELKLTIYVFGSNYDSEITVQLGDLEQQEIQIEANQEVTQVTLCGIANTDNIVIRLSSSGVVSIDSIILCQQSLEEGFKNHIFNPAFETGVGGWTNSSGIDLIPADDSRWYDSEAKAIKIDIGDVNEVRQTMFSIPQGQALVTFSVLSHNLISVDDTIVSEPEFGFEYGILDSLGDIIYESNVNNSSIEVFPYQVAFNFTVPEDGEATLFIKSSSTAGVARVSNVNTFTSTSGCASGAANLSYTDFTNNKRDGWSGGILADSQVTITKTDKLSRYFQDLPSNSLIQITIGVSSKGGIKLKASSGLTTNEVISTDEAGYKTFTINTDQSKALYLEVSANTDQAKIDSIILCQIGSGDTRGTISHAKINFKWNGVPRAPINLFNAFVKYTVRDYNNPLIKSEIFSLTDIEGHYDSVTPNGCSVGTADFWKQNTNGGIAQNKILTTDLNQLIIKSIEPDSTHSIRLRENWLWSIPSNKNSLKQDELHVELENNAINGLVESIEIFFLANAIEFSDTESEYCSGGYVVADPAESFELSVTYKNEDGAARKLATNILISDLLPQQEQYGDFTSPWDIQTKLYNGVKGYFARWESVKFILDTTAGDGLDQSSLPLTNTYEGEVSIELDLIGIDANGEALSPCEPEIIITEVVAGSLSNDIQLVTIPDATGGTWDLTIAYQNNTETLSNIALGISNTTLQNLIGAISFIGVGNVSVQGNGTTIDPYRIEYIGALAGVNVPLAKGNGDNLIGGSTGIVTTLINGTVNERQIVKRTSSSATPLILTFNGDTTSFIAYNATINEKEALISSLSTIGPGNVSVSGTISDRDVPYTGDLFIDFIGILAGMNMPAITVNAPFYSAETAWNGGRGADELQQVEVIARGGTFTLTINDPNPTSGSSYTTSAIDFNASEDDIWAAIISAPFFAPSDVDVNKLPQDPSNLDMHKWVVRFTGTFISTNFDQMTIDTTNLFGGRVLTSTFANGSKRQELQTIEIINANRGTYKLSITLSKNDAAPITFETDPISFNASATDLRSAILEHPSCDPGDVFVSRVTDLDELGIGTAAKYRVRYSASFGNVDTMIATYLNTLFCDRGLLPAVQYAPYEYNVPLACELVDGCQTNPPLSKPCVGEPHPSDVKCCDSTNIRPIANRSIGFIIQRDLFDPNAQSGLTIRDVVLSKGYKPSDYTPFFRNPDNTLSEADYTLSISNAKSVIIIDNLINTVGYRREVIKHIKEHREILPARVK